MPVRVPEHRIKESSGQPKTVREIPIGGSMYTFKSSVTVTPEREAWVYLGATAVDGKGVFVVRIDRTEAGYRMVIPRMDWEAAQVRWEVEPMDTTKGYAPIIEIVEEE